MRSLDPSLIGTLDDPFVMPVTFVKLQFDDAPLFMHTDVGDITIAGNTYLGAGDFGSIEGIEEREDASPSGLTLSLSGIDTALLNEALLMNYFDRPVQILFGMRDIVTGGMVSTPFEIFAGKMDQMRVRTGGPTSVVEVSVESEMIDFDRSLNRYFSDTELQRVYTGDLAFRYLADMVNARVTVGSKLQQSFANPLASSVEPNKKHYASRRPGAI
jgi:hypothetical protein